MNDPKLLIVEPTAGLDPEERIRFRNLLVHLAADRAVILSTHIVGDIGRLGSGGRFPLGRRAGFGQQVAESLLALLDV